MICENAGRYGIEHVDVAMRPTFDPKPNEPKHQALCAFCWDQYEGMVYRMWQSHVG